MSKTRRASRAPPRKEASAVTIGNLERELHNREIRINDLIGARDDANRQCIRLLEESADLRHQLALKEVCTKADRCALEEAQVRLARTETHIEGYRMALADLMQPDRIPRIR